MKTRIISALVMCAIAIPILIIGGLPFKIFTIVIAILSLYELIKAREKKSEIPIFIKILSYILIGVFIGFSVNLYTVNYEFIYKIIIGFILLSFIPVVFINNTDKYSITDALYVLGGTLFLAVAYTSFVLIDNISLLYIIYIIIIAMVTDMFAYFTGYFIGKNKMCEMISPKKTWEGAIGGSLIGTIVGTLFYVFLIHQNSNLLIVIAITLLLSIIGQIGDLFFSSIKRHYKIKDFSKLIPGHGGILDRLDSIIFVVLTFVLFINIL